MYVASSAVLQVYLFIYLFIYLLKVHFQVCCASLMLRDTFESKFEETLTTEMRRQGLADYSSVCRAIVTSSRRVGLTGWVVDVTAIQLNDRGCVSLVEALLKLCAHPQAPPEWSVNMSRNVFTDRVAGHLALLLQRCPNVVLLDISQNANLTPAALQKLFEAYQNVKRSANPRLEVILGSPGVASQSTTVSAATTNSTPNALSGASNEQAEVAALKRRREAQSETSPVVGPAAAPKGPAAAREATSATSSPQVGPLATVSSNAKRTASHSPPKPKPKLQAATHADPAVKQRSPSPAQRSRSGSHPRPPPGKKAELTPSKMAVQSNFHAVPSSRSTVPQVEEVQPNTQRRSSGNPFQSDSDAPAKGAFSQQQKSTKSSTTSPAARPQDKKQTTNRITQAALAQHQQASASPPFAAQPRAPSSEGTTATEVPDHQDFLDITANMNPMIDNMVSLENQGVSTDVLMRRLKKAFASPATAGLYSSVTILNLSSNHLPDFDASVFPQTLLRVDLSDNLLTCVPRMGHCSMLAVLNLRRNRIATVGAALEGNLNIGHLFLGRNALERIDGIGHLWVLETLDLSFNRIASLVSLRPLSLNGSLRHLVLHGNPLEQQYQTKGSSYRPALRNFCPSLVAVDNTRLPFSRIAEQNMRNEAHFLNEEITKSSARRSQSPMNPAKDRVGYAVRNMMNKGVTGVVAGYSCGSAARKTSQRMKQEVGRCDARTTASRSTRDPPSRKGVLKVLCKQSKQFLEKTIVERLTAADRLAELQGSAVFAARAEKPLHVPQPQVSETAPAAAATSAARRSESLDDDRWHEERERARLAAQSASPLAPIMQRDERFYDSGLVADDMRAMYDAASSPAPNADRVAALAYKHTASSKERIRSLPSSNGSSRTPSPHFADTARPSGTAVTKPNEPIVVSSAHAADGRLRRSMSPVPQAPLPYPLLKQGGVTPRERQHKAAQQKSAVKATNATTPARSARHGALTSPFADNTDEIILSPEGASAFIAPNPKDVSPIRGSGLDFTDVSADGADFVDRLVPRMDPGAGASPLPRPAAGKTISQTPIADRSAASRHLISPRKENASRAGSALPRPPLASGRSSSPVARGESSNAMSTDVKLWIDQFFQDLHAVQVSLRTLVRLIGSCFAAPDSAAVMSLLEERSRCLDVITHSKILEDTEIPLHVVRQFSFEVDELNGAVESHVADHSEGRTRVLSAIREMGSAKTCLRYIVALVESGRDDLLRRYIENVRLQFGIS